MILESIKNYTGDSIIYKETIYSYEELRNVVLEYKNILSSYILEGDVIVIDSDYNFYSVSVLLALSDFNCIIIPIVRTTNEEFNSKIKSSDANKIISFNGKEIKVEIIKQVTETYNEYDKIISQNHSGIVLFSSGTTGSPKVMVHDFSILIENFKPPIKQKKIRFILFLMFDHIGGINTLLNCINMGVPIIIPEKRTPDEILKLIEKHKANILPTSPTFLNMMLLSEEFKNKDISSLKMVTYGTERMPNELLKKINKLLPKVKLLQTFGTSETGILKTQSKSSSSLYFKIVDNETEYKVIDNELFLRSKISVNGYKNQKSDKFLENGWFATGDLVELDSEGYMKIIGRINNIINVGGLKVYPIEIEDIINSINGVIDSTVYGIDNPITGQVVGAKVIIDDINNKFKIKSLINKSCKENLDKFKWPVKLVFDCELKHTNRFKKS